MVETRGRIIRAAGSWDVIMRRKKKKEHQAPLLCKWNVEHLPFLSNTSPTELRGPELLAMESWPSRAFDTASTWTPEGHTGAYTNINFQQFDRVPCWGPSGDSFQENKLKDNDVIHINRWSHCVRQDDGQNQMLSWIQKWLKTQTSTPHSAQRCSKIAVYCSLCCAHAHMHAHMHAQ